MNTSEVLHRTADLIEERGWVGEGGKGWDHDTDVPLCLEGAIQAALGMTAGINTTAVNTCPAGRAVRDYLDLEEFAWGRTRALFEWNDEARFVDGVLTNLRTATEVIEVLRAAALIEAAREQDAAFATYAEVTA